MEDEDGWPGFWQSFSDPETLVSFIAGLVVILLLSGNAFGKTVGAHNKKFKEFVSYPVRDMTSPLRYFSAFALYVVLLSGFYFVLSFLGGSFVLENANDTIPASSVPLYVALALTGIMPLAPEAVNLEHRLRSFVHSAVGVPRIVSHLFSEVRASRISAEKLNDILRDIFPDEAEFIRDSCDEIGPLERETCVRWVRCHFLLDILRDNNRLVETLGRSAAKRILRRRKRIDQVREDLLEVDGRLQALIKRSSGDPDSAEEAVSDGERVAAIDSFWLQAGDTIDKVFVSLLRVLCSGIVSSGYSYRKSLRKLNQLGFEIRIESAYEELHERTVRGLLMLIMFGTLTTIGVGFVLGVLGLDDSYLAPTDVYSCIKYIATGTIPTIVGIITYMKLMQVALRRGEWSLTSAILPGLLSILAAFAAALTVVCSVYVFQTGSLPRLIERVSSEDLITALIGTIPAAGLAIAYGWAVESRDFGDPVRRPRAWCVVRCSAFSVVVPLLFASLIAMKTHFGFPDPVAFREFMARESVGYAFLILISFSFTAAFFFGFGVNHVVVHGSGEPANEG